MAKYSGRRSLADLNSAEFISVIQPIRTLKADELAAWNVVMASWPHDHWIGSDAELLTQYCGLCVLFDKLLAEGDVPALDKLGRLILSYATKMRITPQSRYDEKTVARRAEHGRENEASANRLLGGSAWSGQTSNPN
jgi:hypothetical protein